MVSKSVLVAIAFFLSTEMHAKRLLTIWKRSVWTTLKRPFAVLSESESDYHF